MVGFGLGLDCCIGIGCLLSTAQLAGLDCVGWPQSLSAPASEKREKRKEKHAPWQLALAGQPRAAPLSPPPSGDWRLAIARAGGLIQAREALLSSFSFGWDEEQGGGSRVH